MLKIQKTDQFWKKPTNFVIITFLKINGVYYCMKSAKKQQKVHSTLILSISAFILGLLSQSFGTILAIIGFVITTVFVIVAIRSVRDLIKTDKQNVLNLIIFILCLITIYMIARFVSYTLFTIF